LSRKVLANGIHGVVRYSTSGVADHHSVYVVYLKDPKGDGRAAYYVGMTGLTPEERFENHKTGVKACARGEKVRRAVGPEAVRAISIRCPTTRP
jgi:hypothetical protein